MSRAVGKHNLLKAFARRSYSAQAAANVSSSSEINVNVSSKNVRLVSAYENAALSKVSYSFKAGTRYELPDTLGLTHVLRHAIGLSTHNYTAFNIHKNASQHGFNLYASIDRDTFTVTVETHPSQLNIALSYLNSVATEPAFKPWEIEDNRNRLKLDVQLIPPQAKILDVLHELAYRDGLGNSLFIAPSRINKFNYEHCLQYFNEHFTTKRLQITSAGVDANILGELVSAVNLESNDGPQAAKPKYYGGEIRIKEYKENNTYVVVAGEAPGYSTKEYAPYAVLQYVYANIPPVKYGNGVGILNKALAKTGVAAAVTGIAASYPDSGLVGFFFVGNSSDAAKGYDSVVNAFLKSDITDKDVARAKALAKLKFLSLEENASSIVDILSRQVTIDQVITPSQLAAAVDTVTTADVKLAARKIISGKLSVVGYGDTAALPYLDSIKK